MQEDTPPPAGDTLVSRALRTLGQLSARTVRAMAPATRAVLGEWSPPGWLRGVGRGLSRAGGFLGGHAAATAAVVVIAGVAAWQAPNVKQHWRQWAPAWANVGLVADRMGAATVSFQVVEPALTDVANNAPPHPLLVTFSAPAAPALRVGHEPADLTMEPALAGKWTWTSATQLEFAPKQDWPVGGRYHVAFGAKTLAAHVDADRREFDFSAPAFRAEISGAEFYQDPVQPALRKVVVTLDFSHPVDTQSLESRVTLDDGASRKFSVTYDKFHLQATLQSEPLAIPAETRALQVRIAAGVQSVRGGQGTADAIVKSVDIPGLYSLAIPEIAENVVSNDAGDPEHVLRVTASMAVHEREMARAVHAWMLPVSDKEGGEAFAWSDASEVTPAVLKRATPLKLEPIAGEREVIETTAFRMPSAEGGRFLFVRVDAGLKTPGGYQLGAARPEILQVKTFAPELSIMSRGSLLALSGEKKLPLLVRDLPGVKIDIARVLPHQLHLLASQAGGDFSHPNFYGSFAADNLVEHFERELPLTLRPGRSHYETVDFGEYLKTPAGERRGVFLLRVQGWDPKSKAAHAGRPGVEVDDPAQGQNAGGCEGEGCDGGNGGNGDGGDSGGSGDNGGDASGSGSGLDPSTMRDTRLVVVTDLGLVMKKNADGTREVFVQSIANGAPVHGATLEIWGRNGLVLATATTDASGHASLANLAGFQREKAPVLLVARKDSDLSFLPFGAAAQLGRGERALDMSRFDVGGVSTSGIPNQMSAFLFSDRGIYRPGDTIHVGVVVKAANWATSIKDLPVEAEVIDARGLSVRRETLFLGASGATEVTIPTQDSSPTGNWTVNVSLPRQTGTGGEIAAMQLGTTTVKVQEFLPDRSRVVAHLSSEVDEGWVRPEELKLKVNVQNLFGTPAQHRRIDATMTLSPGYPSFRSWPDWSFHDPSRNYRNQTDDLGTVQSDEQGEAEIDLRLARFESATYLAHVLVKAFEPEGGRSVATEVQSLVSDRPYLVGVKTVDSLSYVTRNAKRVAEFVAIDSRAHRIAADGLKLMRVEHKTLSVLVKQGNGLYKYESRSKDVTVDEKPFKLPAPGASVVLDTATPGNFALQVRDTQDLVLNAVEYSVAGAANLTRSLDRNAELQIKLAKPEWTPGEDIELSIQAPYTGAGLITIERDKVYAHAWFKTDKTASVQHITLPKDFEGNGYVSVQFIRDPASDEIYTSPLSYGAVPFATGLQKRTAKVTLTSTPLVKPGEPVKISLKSDRPARAFVFAIDEGILQVARYQTPDPLKFFFQKRALEVGTMQTLDLILPEFRKLLQGAAPGGDAAGEAGKHLNPFKRKTDKPVAWWSGLVEVNGQRDFSYTVPESYNGSLRVMAVVIADDAVAAARADTTVRGDLVLLPTIPTSMTPGDTVDIGVGVANNIAGSGKDASVRVALNVTGGLEVVGEPAQVLKIGERGEGSTVFHVRAKPGAQAVLGSSSVVFVASSGKSGAKLSTDLSVRPASSFVTLVQSGTALGAGELKSQLDPYPNFARSDLAVSATPWSFASGLIRFLDAYPYGCTEQIASQTLPAVVLAGQPELARELQKSKPVGSPPFDPKAALDRAVSQLRARQSADGGIALWPGNGADDFATTYALQLLLEAKDRKMAVPADMVSKASLYVQGRLGSGDTSAWGFRMKAQMAWLLTRQGVLVPAALSNLREQWRANVKEMKDKADAKDPRARYWRRLDLDLGSAYLAASFQILRQDAVANELVAPVWDELVGRVKRNETRDYWDSYYDPLVHDTMLLTLVARHFPQRLQSLPPATWDRLAKMIGDGWYNSQSSATTILAVDAYARAAAASAKGRVDTSIVDPKGVAKPLPLVGELRVLAQAPVPFGTAKVKISNPGELPLFYAWAESGYERPKSEASIVHGLQVEQEILDAKGKAISEARLGDEVTVHLSIRAVDRDAVRQIALVALLPSGLEPVLNPGSGEEGDGDMPLWKRRIGGSGSWDLTYADIREDRVIFFGDVSRAVRDITFKARATNTGQFATPAAFGEAMYERRVFGRSGTGHFTVLPAGK